MPALGEVVGRWRLDRLIGDGAHGRVWLAHLRSNPDDQVAIKLIQPWSFEGAVDRFAREAEILRRLSHPNIVGHRGSGTLPDQGRLFLVMDLVEGEDLAARLKRGRLSPDEARRLFRDLAVALRYVHATNVYHRDLKPQNVMIRPDGSGCVIDFGIAAAGTRSDLTGEGMVPGTAAYMPPEVFSTGVRPDPALSDIYALGVMLYEAVSGNRAFPTPSGITDQQAVMRIIADKLQHPELSPPADIPQDIRALIHLATDPNPDLRVATMSHFAEKLGAPPLPAAVRPRSNQPLSDAETVWGGDDDDDEPSVEWGVGPRTSPGGRDDAVPLPGREAAPVPPPPRFTAPAKPAAPPPVAVRSAPTAPPAPPLFQRPEPPPPKPPPAPPPPLVTAGATAQALPPDPPPPESPPPSTNWKALVAAAAVIALFAMGSAATALWWIFLRVPSTPTMPTTPEPAAPVAAATRDVEIAVAADSTLTVDGQSRPALNGSATIVGLAVGEHAVAVSSGPGCATGNASCCSTATGTLTLPLGEGTFPWTAPTPERVAGARPVVLQVSGPGASGRLEMFWDDQRLPRSAAGYRADAVTPGLHTWRADAGTCAASHAGCAARGDCPKDCVSNTGEVRVDCGTTPQVEAVVLTSPSKASTTPSEALPTDPKPPREVKPPKEKLPTEKPPEPEPEPPKEITVRVSTTITVDKPLDTASAQSAAARIRPTIESCYRRVLSGSAMMPRTASYQFSTDKAGAVDPGSVKIVSSSSESQLDSCGRDAIKGMVIGGKKAGTGKVVVRFESF